MYSLRNKNKERFRTQIIRETVDDTPDQFEKPYLFHSPPPSQSKLSNSRQSQQSFQMVIKNLQKHIEFIQKRLAESEAEKQNIKNNSEWLRQQLDQKDDIIERQLIKIRQGEKLTKDILLKYQNLKTDVQNYKLQQKMEKLTRQINQQKEIYEKTEAQYARRKDKFSAAFLPSPFGSAKHFSEKPSQIFESIVKEEVSEVSYISKSPFEQSLWSQWKKLKNEKVKRDKEIALQANSIQKLKNDLIAQKKEFQKVKMEFERRQNKNVNEINKLKSRIVTYIKDQKLLMNKLKLNEQKMMELSLSMKDRGQSDGDRFFAHSSALQLQQIFEKISHNLDIDSSTIDLTIENNKKVEAFTQTNDKLEELHSKKVTALEQKIKQLQEELINKQKQLMQRLQQTTNSYISQLKDASDMMDLYKCRIQHLSKMVSDQESENLQSKLQENNANNNSKEVSIQCKFFDDYQIQRNQLLEKVRILMELKQEQAQRIVVLNQKNQQLSLKIEEDLAKQKIDRLRWIQQTKEQYQLNEMEQNKEIKCQNCIKWKELLAKSQLQHIKLVQNMEKKISQTEHFEHSFQDILNKYYNLENETQSEINKLKSELTQKQKLAITLSIQVEQKNSELANDKEQIDELKKTVTKLQNQIEIYQQKID